MQHGTVCLTFDFDAVSLWVARRMTTATPVSRGEFGAVAVPRILDLLAQRELPSTWFVPGHTIQTYPEVCQNIVAHGHEIALHGYAHENVASLDRHDEKAVFDRSLEIIQKTLGHYPRGFRAPSWDLSSHSVDIMLEKELLYDSSLMSHDYRPFYCRQGDQVPPDGPMVFGRKSSLVELPVSWALDDYPQFEYLRMPGLLIPGLRNPEEVFRNWRLEADYMLRHFEDGVTVFTFHPQVIGRGHRLLGLESWLDELIQLGDVEFARMDDVAGKFQQGREYGRYRPGTRES